MINLKIPAKVMLSGEYAVLYGGTAAMMPVPRQLVVSETTEKQQKNYSPVVETALSCEIEELKRFEDEHGKPQLKFDDSRFFHIDTEGNRLKLGLGLSAAEAVGVIALRFLRAGFKHEDAIGNIAMYSALAHSHAQEGSGSGADVAACAFELPLLFRRTDREIDVDIREFPDIPLALYYTGRPADTRKLVAEFSHLIDHEGITASGPMAKLVELSHKLSQAWFQQDRDRLFEYMDSYLDILRTMAIRARMRYYLEIHEEISNWAVKHGGRAKPTGAGGGDMILLVGDLPLDQLDGLVIRLN
ncbi:MAG: hypothetical protein GF404_01695 [candidate division Zixibacteria bacterium]|nr:hypothetical protein [candidate division Zixibacteria bacterium]